MKFDIWNDCPKIPLPEVLSFIVDNRGKTVPTAEKGYILIATNCVKNENLYPSYEKIRFLSKETYHSWFRAHPKPGDILFVCKGTPGKCCMVPDPLDFCIAQDMVALRVNTKIIYNYYLLAILRSREIQLQIFNTSVGDVIPHFKKKFFYKIMIPVPSMKVQKIIGDYYRIFSLKIELNNRINDNLEQQLRAIFRAEFTDNPKLESITQIPLAELCHVITKGTTPTTLGKPFIENGINFIKAESILDDHSIDKSKFAFIDEETNTLLKRSIIHAGDVVFTIAGTLGRFALIDDNVLPANTNQAVAIIRANVEKVLPEYIYACFIGEWHTDYYAKRIQQAVQANLSLTTIKSLPIPLLDDIKMGEYLQVILPIIKAIKGNEAQNEALAALRDNLLPKLMSGELDVSAIEL